MRVEINSHEPAKFMVSMMPYCYRFPVCGLPELIGQHPDAARLQSQHDCIPGTSSADAPRDLNQLDRGRAFNRVWAARSPGARSIYTGAG